MVMQALDFNINSHTLMALAGVGSFLLGLPLEGALLFFLFHFAHVLESKFVSGAERSLEGLLDALPQKVRKVKSLADGSLDWSNQQQVRVEDVDVGTLIVVKPGEVLPLDGTVVEGSALVGALQILDTSLRVYTLLRGAGAALCSTYAQAQQCRAFSWPEHIISFDTRHCEAETLL